MPRCARPPPFCRLGSCLLHGGSADVWQSLARWQRPWKYLLLLHILRLSPRSEAIRSENQPPDGTSRAPDQQVNLDDAFELSDGFDVNDDSILYNDRAKERASGIGEPCHGSRYHSRGDCGSIYVQSPSGSDWLVQLYCYSQDSTTTPGTKAGKGKSGVCQVPRTKQCYEDEHCRRGTYCLSSDTDAVYTCQEASLRTQYIADTRDRTASVVGTLLMVAVGYIQSLASTAPGASTISSLIHDPRTGAVSPYGANRGLAQLALGALLRSFSDASAANTQAPAASKSKAIFVFSGDGRFLIKSVRKEEFTNFVGIYAAKIARLSGLADVECDNADKEWCWAAAMLERTALVVPVLSFSSPATNDYWLVMPAASLFRGLVISRQEEKLNPWGEASYYDVKPWPAKSNARAKFLWKFARWHMLPFARDGGAENVNQWVSFGKSIQMAVELLGGVNGDDSSSSVDYSLLFEVYKPNRTLANPGQNCVASRDCFPNGKPSSCRVICVSIIDFLTTFNFARKIESFWKDGKFNAYNGKVTELVNCLAAPREELPGSKILPTQHDDQPGFEVAVTVDSNWETKNYQVCLPYLEMACSDVLTQTCCCNLADSRVKFILSQKTVATRFCFNYLAMMNWVRAKPKKTKVKDKLADARIAFGATATHTSEGHAGSRQGTLLRPQ